MSKRKDLLFSEANIIKEIVNTRLNWHYKIFCVNVKYRIQNRVLYFLFYIFTPKE